MNKKKKIDALYKILGLYEDCLNDQSDVSIDNYLHYVDRLYVRWLGIGEPEIYETLRGLWTLGAEAGQERVKSLVFHMISFIEKDKSKG